MKIRIAARQSDLARLQAYAVGHALKRAQRGLELEFIFKESLGDKNLTDPLWKMPERGVFTEDFVFDLLDDKVELVVHSWKDLPTEPRPGLQIGATLERADPRDLLLFRKDSVGKRKLTLLTSSPRRTFTAERELAAFLPFQTKEITTKPVRGNVVTRLKKLALAEGDGLFMAKAALDRLLTSTDEEESFHASRTEIRDLLENFHFMVLPLSVFPTAPAQGALAVEISEKREDLKKMLSLVHHEETAACVERERSRFAKFGGGCHQKIGITAISHPKLGPMDFFHGHPENEEPSRRVHFGKTKLPVSPGLSIWPEVARPVFKRSLLDRVKNPGDALFVARADALPEHWKLRDDQLVWTAGTQTWKGLAKKGVWVNGTSDGLGESIPELKALVGRPVEWTKLTHEESGNTAQFRCLATYRLDPLPNIHPPLAHAYFWPSESLFRWALGKRPEIRSAMHASGPGYTAQAIEKELGRSIDVYYNYAHWRTGDPYAEA
ncbi:MAG TPA: hydroxymethylbilane synthase [Bdellovibrionota bacterium]|jgi:hydroxymethylbilane synthase